MFGPGRVGFAALRFLVEPRVADRRAAARQILRELDVACRVAAWTACRAKVIAPTSPAVRRIGTDSWLTAPLPRTRRSISIVTQHLTDRDRIDLFEQFDRAVHNRPPPAAMAIGSCSRGEHQHCRAFRRVDV